MYLVRWVPRIDALLVVSAPVVRNVEYDDWPLVPVAVRPLVPFGAASLGELRDAVLRGSEDDCGTFCSNFFFISFTLARLAAGIPLLVADRALAPSEPTSLSSTGLDAERCTGLGTTRLPGTPGSFEPIPLPFALVVGGWRVLGAAAEAMKSSWMGDGSRVLLADWTPRYSR